MRKLLVLLTLTITAAVLVAGCSGKPGQPNKYADRQGRTTGIDVTQDDIAGLRTVRDSLRSTEAYKERVAAAEKEPSEDTGKADGKKASENADDAAAFDGAMAKAVEAGTAAMDELVKNNSGNLGPVHAAVMDSFKATLGADKLAELLQKPGATALFAEKSKQAVLQCIEKMPAEMADLMKKQLVKPEEIADFKANIDKEDARKLMVEMLKVAKIKDVFKQAMGESAELKAAIDEAAGKYPEIKAALGE